MTQRELMVQKKFPSHRTGAGTLQFTSGKILDLLVLNIDLDLYTSSSSDTIIFDPNFNTGHNKETTMIMKLFVNPNYTPGK